jgi:hypothetical protein
MIDILYLEKIDELLISQLKLIDTIPSINIKDSVKVGELTPYYLIY